MSIGPTLGIGYTPKDAWIKVPRGGLPVGQALRWGKKTTRLVRSRNECKTVAILVHQLVNDTPYPETVLARVVFVSHP